MCFIPCPLVFTLYSVEGLFLIFNFFGSCKWWIGPLFYIVGVGGAAGHLAWQIQTANLNNFSNCLLRFRSNRNLGFLVLLGTWLGKITF